MRAFRLPLGLRAAYGLVVVLSPCAAHGETARPPALSSVTLTPRSSSKGPAADTRSAGPVVEVDEPAGTHPWVVKITPVYGGQLDRVTIRYRHRVEPFVVRGGSTQEVMIRPTVRIARGGAEAWIGLDGDLVWEGRCSVTGQWLAIDADRSGPGLGTPNLRYNLRARRLIVTSGAEQVLVDLASGDISGPVSLIGRMTNLRDYFLARGQRAFRVKVSDRPGWTGTVWIFDDLASVAVGPADDPWFSPERFEPDLEAFPCLASEPSLPLRSVAQPALPLLAPPKEPGHAVADLDRKTWTFGSEGCRPIQFGPASAARPKPLSAWPGKALPPVRPRAMTVEQSARVAQALENLSREWLGRLDRVRQALQATQQVGRALGLGPIDDERVKQCIAAVAERCEFVDELSAATTRPAQGQRPSDVADLTRGLSGLAVEIEKLLSDSRGCIEASRGVTPRASGLAQAEQHCQALAIGSEVEDEVICLMIDLASEGGAPADRSKIAELLADRILTRVRDDVVASMWDQIDLLTVIPGFDPERPLSPIAEILDAQPIDGIRLDAAADRALAVLASTIYADPPAARHFQRHLIRRFPDRLAVAPAGVARLVEDLAQGNVISPDGLAQFMTMSRGAIEERHALIADAWTKTRSACRLAEQAQMAVDRRLARLSTDVTGNRSAEKAYRQAYVRQQEDVLALLTWVCTTYADQIFIRIDLSDEQRKRLIRSAAAWWVRQWGMDLCWVDLGFELEVKRQDGRYAWRVHDVRIRLLDEPDPEAVVEERMARTAPPQAFPIGPIGLAGGREIVPRTLADLDAAGPPPALAQAAPTPTSPPEHSPGSSDSIESTARRMILPQPPTLAVAAENGRSTTPRAEEPPADRPKPAVGPPIPSIAVASGDPSASPQRELAVGTAATSGQRRAVPLSTGPELARFEPPGPAQPVEVVKPEPAAPGPEVSIPVMLRPRGNAQTRHIAILSGQRVCMMGMVSLARRSEGPVRVYVDLYADDLAAEALLPVISPSPLERAGAVPVVLPSGRWLRRSVRWPAVKGGTESFVVKFRAPVPTHDAETLTMVLSLAERDTDRSECLEQATYVFHLLPESERPRLVAAAP
ncbi:MAG: hypothetical protein JXQ73_06495 [Phycisphaerae bacterium]|nr:hypothetical protein [Phycisphaerae bacterium]